MLTIWEIMNLVVALLLIGGATLMIYLSWEHDRKRHAIMGCLIIVSAIILLIRNVPDSGVGISSVTLVRLDLSIYLVLLGIYFVFHRNFNQVLNITDVLHWIILPLGIILLLVFLWSSQVVIVDTADELIAIDASFLIAGFVLGVTLLMDFLEWRPDFSQQQTELVTGGLLVAAFVVAVVLPNVESSLASLFELAFVGAITVNLSRIMPATDDTDLEQQLKQKQRDLNQLRLELLDAKSEIQNLTQNLDNTNRYKQDFLSNMSHEFRTPLNAVIGYGDLLQSGMYGELNEKQQDRLERILENGNHLLRLVSDILDLNQLDTTKKYLDVSALDMRIIVEHVISNYEPDIQAKSLQVLLGETSVPHVFGDQDQVIRIVDNLFSNALKFTHEGEINLALKYTRVVAGESDPVALPARGYLRDGDWVILQISDTGIGINPEDQARIFDAFVRVEDKVTKQIYGGTGAGLALVKKLVELHNGAIWLRSVPGEGSDFFVAFPSESPESE